MDVAPHRHATIAAASVARVLVARRGFTWQTDIYSRLCDHPGRGFVGIAGARRRRFRRTYPRRLSMTCSTIIKSSAAAVCIIAFAGCTDLKPLQAQIDDLKSQVSKLDADVAKVSSE